MDPALLALLAWLARLSLPALLALRFGLDEKRGLKLRVCGRVRVRNVLLLLLLLVLLLFSH